MKTKEEQLKEADADYEKAIEKAIADWWKAIDKIEELEKQ